MRIGYKRVSSIDQSTARQLVDVRLDKIYEDHASGKSADRPQLQECLAALQSGDTLVVHSMDRLARNLEDLRRIVRELNGRGVKVEFIKENLTFAGDDSPMSMLLLNMMGAFAEFERALINERQREGIRAAAARGDLTGRPPALSEPQIDELRVLLASGATAKQCATRLDVSLSTVYRFIRRKSAA